MDQREVPVEVVVAVVNVEAAGCSMANTADSSKEMVVVVVVVEGVVLETGSDPKDVDSKLMQTRGEGQNIAKLPVPGVDVHLLLLALHSPSRTAKCWLYDHSPQWHLLLMSATHGCAA